MGKQMASKKKKTAPSQEGISREDKISRGSRAKQIIEDPLWVEAFDALDTRYETEWRSSAETDTAKRESMYMRLKVLEDVKLHFEEAVTSGKVAKQQ